MTRKRKKELENWLKGDTSSVKRWIENETVIQNIKDEVIEETTDTNPS